MKQKTFSVRPAAAAPFLVGVALLGFANDGQTQGGTVLAWGDNRFGQATVPSGLSNVVAIASGE